MSEPRDVQTVIKTLWALLFFTGLLFLVLVVKSAQAGIYTDVSLGSMIGDIEQPDSGQMPFWAEAGYAKYGMTAGVGHRSNADYNGNELDYEYVYIGRTFSRYVENLPLYGCIEAQHALRDELKGENILSIEGGLRRDNVSFGLFYESATGLNIQGAKASLHF